MAERDPIPGVDFSAPDQPIVVPPRPSDCDMGMTERERYIDEAVALQAQLADAGQSLIAVERTRANAAIKRAADAEAQHDSLYLAVKEEVERLRAESDPMARAGNLAPKRLVADRLQAILDKAGEKREVPDYGERAYSDGGRPGGTCPCGRTPDPGIKPEGGCWCTEEQKGADQ